MINKGDAGHLILTFKPDAKPTIKNICGTIRLLSSGGSFKGLAAVDDAPENGWAVKKMKWDFGEDDVGGVEYGLIAYKTLDDIGNRFIQFVWDQGSSEHTHRSGYYLAKKRSPNGTCARLSKMEKERLGIGLTNKELTRNADTEAEEETGVSKNTPVEEIDQPKFWNEKDGEVNYGLVSQYFFLFLQTTI
jgi:hypothetical protein